MLIFAVFIVLLMLQWSPYEKIFGIDHRAARTNFAWDFKKYLKPIYQEIGFSRPVAVITFFSIDRCFLPAILFHIVCNFNILIMYFFSSIYILYPFYLLLLFKVVIWCDFWGQVSFFVNLKNKDLQDLQDSLTQSQVDYWP